MKDYRLELMAQVNTLSNWIDTHAYDDRYTQARAKKSLYLINQIWNELERRNTDRRVK